MSCNDLNDQSVTFVKVNNKEIASLNIRDVTQSVPMQLSDLLENVEFIKMDPQKNVYIGEGGHWLIGEKHIILSDFRQGILQFSRNGEFIRKLVPIGTGPKEVMNMVRILFSPDEKLLYITSNKKKRYMLCLDLKSGDYLNDMPFATSSVTNSIIFMNDTTILVSRQATGESEDEFLIYTQNLNGKLIDGVRAPQLLSKWMTTLNIFYRIKDVINFKPMMVDTVYSFKDKLVPIYFFNHKNKSTDPMSLDIGRIRYQIYFENASYTLFKTMLMKSYTEVKQDQYNVESEERFIIYDKKSKKLIHLKSFKNNYINKEIGTFDHTFQQNGYMYTIVDALTCIELAKKVKNNEVKIANSSAFLKMANQLKEDDNPVLLIGKMKDIITLNH